MKLQPDMNAMEDRQQISLLHRALCLGCTGFLGVLVFLWMQGTVPLAPTLPAYLQWIGYAAPFVIVPTAFAAFRSLLKNMGSEPSAQAMVQRVRSACIAHWALIEMGAFLNFVIFLLSANWANLVLGAATLVLLMLRGPKEAAYFRWLNGTP